MGLATLQADLDETPLDNWPWGQWCSPPPELSKPC